MVAMSRIFEGVICMAFYAGICYLLLDGAGLSLSIISAYYCIGTHRHLQS